MPIVTGDWSIDRTNGNIRYGGADHTGAATYATVIEFHRFLQDLADDASSVGDDEVDITDELPSSRSTDNIINLLGVYNIDDTAAEHLYDGSILQGTGATIYDGIVNFGNTGISIQIIQSGAVLADDWWNSNGGLNVDATQGISHRFMLKTRLSGADIDGKRLVGTTREFGNTYGEFSINGTARGNNVLALVNATDLNNTTPATGVATWDTIDCNLSGAVDLVDGVNSLSSTTLNVTDGTAFSTGDFIHIEPDEYEYQVTAIAANALTIAPGLEAATTGNDTINRINYGYAAIDVNNDTTDEYYFSEWTKAGYSINQFYERMKWLTRDGSTERIFGLDGELFRGITHEIQVDTPTGTFADVELVTWGTGATAGSGQMLAINSTTAATKIWIQLLTGVVPSDGVVITGNVSGATVTMDTNITERTISKPFVGASTGSALIGAYGVGLLKNDLAATDKVTDLDNVVITPPNNVTFTVGGLVSGEDRVLVAPWDGSSTDNEGNPAIDVDQLTLSVDLTGAETSVVVTTAIPSDTPATGTIRVLTNSGKYKEVAYTAWSGSTFTVSSDFSSDNATGAKNVWIAYIDELASGTSATFTSVYDVDRNLVVIVRDGGASPIKQFISEATLGSNGGSITAIRTTDA